MNHRERDRWRLPLTAESAALQAEPLATFERDALKLQDDLDDITRFRLELKSILEGLIVEVGKRANEANTLLTKTPLTWLPHARISRTAGSLSTSWTRSAAIFRLTTGCTA